MDPIVGTFGVLSELYRQVSEDERLNVPERIWRIEIRGERDFGAIVRLHVESTKPTSRYGVFAWTLGELLMAYGSPDPNPVLRLCFEEGVRQVVRDLDRTD